MKKQYTIQNLDCAHCAMKMETEAKKIPGVTFLSINFVSSKLTLEAEETVFSSVFEKVEKTCRSIEPDVAFFENQYRLSKGQKGELVRIGVAVALFLAAKLLTHQIGLEETALTTLLLFLPAYFVAGFDVIRKAFLGMIHGKFFDENFLMALATVGAFCIGEAGEGVMVMLLYCIGEFFQDIAVSKSRKNVADLMDIRPDRAGLLDGEEIKLVSPDEVPIGSVILVKPGEKIPLDGVVIEGSGFIDTSALTGESRPKEISTESFVASGCINLSSPLRIRTSKSFQESSVSKILDLIENSADSKSKAERFITRFARVYTPAVVILALLLAFVPPLFGAPLSVWIHKAVTCLVISCPCALVISVPLSFFGGIGSAGSRGILIKGAEHLETLAKIKSCAFDKTGTLTKGTFKVTAIHPELISEEELLELATTCEHYSDHPISQSLKAAFRHKVDIGQIENITETAGEGVRATISGKEYFVGNETMMKHAGVSITPCNRCHHKGTVVHIAEPNNYLGHIVISDELRSDACTTVSQLKALGVDRLLLLSGDELAIAEEMGKELGISDIYANLLPQDKLSILTEIQKKETARPLAFVGDGINDTPTLSGADLGIAMGGIGADAAIEAADVVLIDDKPSKIALAIRIARKTLRIVWQNIVLSLGTKLAVLIPNIFLGEESIPIGFAIFADVGVCLIAILNATRTLHIKESK